MCSTCLSFATVLFSNATRANPLRQYLRALRAVRGLQACRRFRFSNRVMLNSFMPHVYPMIPQVCIRKGRNKKSLCGKKVLFIGNRDRSVGVGSTFSHTSPHHPFQCAGTYSNRVSVEYLRWRMRGSWFLWPQLVSFIDGGGDGWDGGEWKMQL